MSFRTLGLIVSLVVFCTASYLLITGSPVLTQVVSESLGMPWGTLITWLGFLGLAGSVYFAFPGIRTPRNRIQRFLRTAWLGGMFLAVAWPFVSYYLAGNWSNTFRAQEEFRGSTRASIYFWYLCAATAMVPLLVLLGAFLEYLLGRKSRG